MFAIFVKLWILHSLLLLISRHDLVWGCQSTVFTHLHHKALVMASTRLRDELVLQTSSFFIELHHWVFPTCCEYRTLSSYLERHLRSCFRAFTSSEGKHWQCCGFQCHRASCLENASFITVFIRPLQLLALLLTQAVAGFPGTDLEPYLQHCLGLSVMCCARTADGKSLKNGKGTNHTVREVTPSLFLLVRTTVLAAWCLHKLNITPAALGISALRVSRAGAVAVVSSSLQSKTLSLKGEISLPNPAHVPAAWSNYILALLSSAWTHLIPQVTCFSRNTYNCLENKEGKGQCTSLH